MLAEINVAITKNGATLVIRKGEAVVDEEIWSFPSIGKTEAAEAAGILFDDAYDFLNACVHGDPLEVEITDLALNDDTDGEEEESTDE